jgi:hypothetical protein
MLAMGGDGHQLKPHGFNVLTRIVVVHQAFALAVLGSGLSSLLAKGNGLHALSTGAGLLIAVATAAAMVGVARQKSLPALIWLRILLWAAVVRGALSVLTLFGSRDVAIASFVRSMLVNEGILIPLAIYWTRAVHGRYLATLRSA